MSNENLNKAIARLAKEANYSAYAAVENAISQSSAKDSSLPSLKIAILRNFTFEPIVPVIKGEVVRAGFYPEIYLGNYDSIAQDVFSQESELFKFQPDVLIIAQWLDALSPLLAEQFPFLTEQQVQTEKNRILESVDDYIAALRRQTKAPILLNNCPLPIYPAYGILDGQSEQFQKQAVLDLNQDLLRRAKKNKDVYLVDYFSLLARIGSLQGIDARYWQMGRAPVGKSALVPFGQEYGKFIRALRGKTRKCLILDCDNVLWGGILGEDGLQGIQLGEGYPGSAYQALQREILNLAERGVILALCSKNNEADVLEILRKHPAMLLREENLAAWQINWDDKATNIKRIAQDLNIGLDSLVFVDDSQFECNLVKEQLPMVEVLEFSSEPSSFVKKISVQGFFDSLTFSSEDKGRNQMYRAQAERKELKASASSLEEYLAKLGMVAEIGKADDVSIQRIAQLTQKTNQFNLTTKRYTEGEIRSFAEDSQVDVFFLKLRDRVSELGLIGVAIVKYRADRAEIDTFLLSCRAIGRGVEQALMAQILNSAQNRGCRQIIGQYLVSPRNEQVADFYGREGFKSLVKDAVGEKWGLDLKREKYSGPSWIAVRQVKEEKSNASV